MNPPGYDPRGLAYYYTLKGYEPPWSIDHRGLAYHYTPHIYIYIYIYIYKGYEPPGLFIYLSINSCCCATDCILLLLCITQKHKKYNTTTIKDIYKWSFVSNIKRPIVKQKVLLRYVVAWQIYIHIYRLMHMQIPHTVISRDLL